MSNRSRPLNRLCFAKLPSWRQAFLLVVGAAFLLQSYVTQTHIHPLAQPLTVAHGLAAFNSDSPAKAGSPDKQEPSRDKLPGNDDPAKCPLCQAVGHAGNYVWPNAAVFILPHIAAAIVPIAAAILGIPERRSHNWQGRAPPTPLIPS